MRTLSKLLDDTKVRFLLIGACNTVFGYAVFWVLYELFSRVFAVRYFAYTTAQVVGLVISVLNGYALHKVVTFRSKTRGRAAFFEFFRFMQTYMTMFLIGLVLLPFLVEVVGMDPRVAALVATVALMLVSYVGHRFRTFRHDHESKPS